MRRLGLVLAGVLLAGCSMMQLGYNAAEPLLRWRGGQYFDFQGEQSEVYAARVGKFMRWHRANALPEYVKFAEEAARRIDHGLSREDLVWGYDAFRGHVRTGLRAAAAEVAGLLDQLAPAQLEHLERRLERDHRDFAKEYLSGTPEERRGKRVKRTVELLEDWVGELSSEQLERVRLYGERAPLTTGMRDRERKRLDGELLAMLRARAAGARLADWAAHWDGNRDPGFTRLNREQQEEYYDLLLDLDKTLSAAQRQRAVRRMRELAGEFAALAGIAR